jgi:hypothetical protein
VRVPVGTLAAFPAIAATVPIATPATSVWRLTLHQWALGRTDHAWFGRLDRRQRSLSGGLRTWFARRTRFARRLPFARLAGWTRFARWTRLALRLSFAWRLSFAR